MNSSAANDLWLICMSSINHEADIDIDIDIDTEIDIDIDTEIDNDRGTEIDTETLPLILTLN